MACTITRYVCPGDRSVIESLASAANVQQIRNTGFNAKIQPWKARCASDDTRHYVARSTSGIICGWLTAFYQEHHGQRAVYIVEISTRRIRDELYGGVGQQLHTALLDDARSFNADYVYLFPLNEAVAAIYERPEWGYVQLRPQIKNLFRILRAPPTEEALNSFMPPDPRKQLSAAMAIALGKKYTTRATNGYNADRRLADLIAKAAPRVIGDAVQELDDLLMIMEGDEMGIAEQREELRQFFSKLLTSSDRRSSTRKLRRNRSARRRR